MQDKEQSLVPSQAFIGRRNKEIIDITYDMNLCHSFSKLQSSSEQQ